MFSLMVTQDYSRRAVRFAEIASMLEAAGKRLKWARSLEQSGAHRHGNGGSLAPGSRRVAFIPAICRRAALITV